MEFSENITRLRTNVNLTRKEVADKLGITLQAYSAYETGGREPRRENILKLADIFGVTTDTLLMYQGVSYKSIKHKLGTFSSIVLTELDGGEVKVKAMLPSDYGFEPAVVMSRADLVDIYKRACKSSLGLENAFRTSIIYEYAQTVFVENPDLATVKILQDVEEPEYDPNNQPDISEFWK